VIGDGFLTSFGVGIGIGIGIDDFYLHNLVRNAGSGGRPAMHGEQPVFGVSMPSRMFAQAVGLAYVLDGCTKEVQLLMPKSHARLHSIPIPMPIPTPTSSPTSAREPLLCPVPTFHFTIIHKTQYSKILLLCRTSGAS